MKNKKSILLGISLLFGVMTTAFADTQTKQYLMWQMPSTPISFPIYVYNSSGTQVGYIPVNTLQEFASEYQSGVTTESYTLYYQDSSNAWHSCVAALLNGSVDEQNSTCPGLTLNKPVPTSNVWTMGPGAIAWQNATTPPVNPTKTNYNARTITFKNDTDYQYIQIGESCSTSGNTPGTCQTTLDLAQIAKGESYQLPTIDKDGLNSSAFYITGYCTASTADECVKDGKKVEKNWVSTGGYGPGEVPYATKIEPTVLPVTNDVPNGASNIDISAVDGYNFGVVLYPENGAYCTYTVPPENSNVLGAGYYDESAPLAKVMPTNGMQSLENLCKNSSQLPVSYGGKDKPWNLVKLDSNNNFQGCISPCTYATKKYGTGSEEANLFCCPVGSPYGTPQSCDAGHDGLSASTSTYTTNVLNSPEFQNVYPFSYGDAGSDYGCPPETNFVVKFVSNKPKPPVSSLTITNVNATGVTANSAVVNWTANDTDPKAGTITYNIITTPTPSTAPSVSGMSASYSGLNNETTYQVVIEASDQDGNKAQSAPFSFTTTAQTYTLTAPTATAANVTQNSATINWTASSDVPTNLNQKITYTVTLTPSVGAPVVTNGLTAALSGLTASTPYSAIVSAQDQDGNSATSTPVSFTTAANAPVTNPLNIMYDTQGSNSARAVVYWDRIAGETCSNTTSVTATPVSGGASVAGTLLCRGSDTEIFGEFAGLSSGQYNIDVTINGVLYQGTVSIP